MFVPHARTWASSVLPLPRPQLRAQSQRSSCTLGLRNRLALSGGWHILKTVETSWVAYALRRLQSVGRSSLEGATNGRQLEFTSTDRFSEAQLLDSNNTNCSRANPPDA
jgi:hypothetical protein